MENKMNINKKDLSEILPHNKPMILIDELLEVDLEKNFARTLVKITEDKVFFDKTIDGVSPLTGIEFMAQTIGCYAYFKSGSEIPKIGFLLGSRSYNCNIEKFGNGCEYEILAKEVFSDNELVSFECFIYNGGIECAKAVVNAYQPDDINSADL